MARRIRKFEPGEAFESVEALIWWCMANGYVYWPHQDARPKHGSWIVSMQARILARQFNKFRRAVPTAEWLERQESADTKAESIQA